MKLFEEFNVIAADWLKRVAPAPLRHPEEFFQTIQLFDNPTWDQVWVQLSLAMLRAFENATPVDGVEGEWAVLPFEAHPTIRGGVISVLRWTPKTTGGGA